MKKSSTIFLRGVVILIGLSILGFCIYITTILDGAGYYLPILIGMLVAAIPFYIGLFQTWKLLSYIDQNLAFSDLSVKALKAIKESALVISGLYLAGMPYIFYAANRDDAPGVVAIGLVIIFASFVVAVFAAVLQKLLQNGMEIKSENDLTV